MFLNSVENLSLSELKLLGEKNTVITYSDYIYALSKQLDVHFVGMIKSKDEFEHNVVLLFFTFRNTK